ncbi:MAG: ligase-associated DNA damage response DEXH box helicase [Burkholderiaceae bacterium]|nr:ligase-associated DNA damage response DEXH box helicase [Burkholderiaceae bacterium]
MDHLPPPDSAFAAWFQARGWNVFDFQREVWTAMREGRSGLLHATTGSGKTYAVWLGALQRAQVVEAAGTALQVLWLTPMRALAADTARALQQPLADLAPQWRVGLRTGDTPAAERARQDRKLPMVLVTTPESLTLLLTRERAREDFGALQVVIVDEWHELIGNKRGVQVQLALARLRQWNPQLVVWGLSATLGNLDEARSALLGPRHGGDAQLVQGRLDKPLQIDTLLPHQPGRFSWGGHLGAQMLQPVVDEIERSSTALVFTNVRSQAETWYQLLLNARPDWAGRIALHHGSLDKSVREWVEAGLKAGTLKAVVATSSLDLGVDFLPVERVLQIGSAKGVARLLQRAGRSGHQPGRASRVTLVPTNTLELVEAVAARRAALAGRVEARVAPDAPLDVLVQHLVSMALAGGFEAEAMYRELRGAWSYRKLSREAFQWALDFVVHGGDSLQAYPEYHRVVLQDGRYRVVSRGIALRHRLQVGTIVADASMRVKWLSGGTLGTVEESFIARLKQGDCFVFGGRVLEYVRTQDMAAYVRKATGKRGIVPAWSGGRMPLSSELADATLRVLDGCAQGDWLEPELQAAQPMLQAQLRLSKLPTPTTLLVERFRSREGHHLFIYPFAGRLVHLGLASLLAWRLSRGAPNSFSLSVNDYGFELLAADEPALDRLHSRVLFDEAELLSDVLASLNSGELAQRRFREIARVAGLVFSGYPGAPKSTRQLQASSSLFFEVFRKYDPGNRLLGQAEAEVLSQELQISRLRAALKRMRKLRLDFVELAAPSPFSLPLMVERFREQLTTEKLADRLARILKDAEAALAKPDPRKRRRRGTAA